EAGCHHRQRGCLRRDANEALRRPPPAGGTGPLPVHDRSFAGRPSQRWFNNYGQVGELFRMVRSLRVNVYPSRMRLNSASPVLSGAIRQRLNDAEMTFESSCNFVMQSTRVIWPFPVTTNPSGPQCTNL